MASAPGEVRVLRAITRLNIGGPARQALLLSAELGDPFVSILAAGKASADEGELVDPAVGVTHVHLTRPISPRLDVRATRELRSLIRAWRPHIVHSHMAKAGALARLTGGPRGSLPLMIHTFHGHVLEGYFKRPVEQTFLQLERVLARRTNALVAVSPQIRDSLLELGVGKPHQWHVIPLGFDLRKFASIEGRTNFLRTRLGLGSSDHLIGVVGRLAPIKDHKTLLDAIALIPDVHLAIFGDGELSGELKKYSDQLRISNRVHFMGWCLDMPGVIPDLDLVALTSRNEGTPVSLIEGLASARPVVATDVGGVRAVVEQGVSGLVVAPGDSAAVAQAITDVVSNPARARAMGMAGREHVLATFSKQRLLDDIRELYQSLLDQRDPSGV